MSFCLSCNHPNGRYPTLYDENAAYKNKFAESTYLTLQEEIDTAGNGAMGAQIVDSDLVQIGKDNYEYAEENIYGGSSGNIYDDFILKDIESSEKFILSYSEWQEGMRIESRVERNENIVPNSSIDSFLTHKLLSSSLISRITMKKGDLQMEINKWLHANTDKYHLINETVGIDFNFNFPRTDKNLFALEGATSEVATASNNNYEVKSFFKHCVVAKDKAQNKYFIVWCPYDIDGWMDSLTFTSNNDVVFFKKEPAGKEEMFYSIDLKHNIISRFE